MTVLTQAAIGGNNLCGNVRFQHVTAKVHQLGPRPLGEMLAKLARLHPEVETDLLSLLNDYANMDGAFLAGAGLDRWPRVLVAVPDIKAGFASHQDIVKAALSCSGDDAA